MEKLTSDTHVFGLTRRLSRGGRGGGGDAASFLSLVVKVLPTSRA